MESGLKKTLITNKAIYFLGAIVLFIAGLHYNSWITILIAIIILMCIHDDQI